MKFLPPLVAALTSSWGAPADVHFETGDTLEIRPCEPLMCIYYYNAAGKESRQGSYVREWSGMVFDIYIKVGDAETITVTPRDESVVVDPPEIDILDGQDTLIRIYPPMF